MTHRACESEPRPQEWAHEWTHECAHEWTHEGAHESPREWAHEWTHESRVCPREPPREPTTAAKRVDFPCYQPFKDSPRKLPRNVPRRRPRKCPRKCPLKWSRFTFLFSPVLFLDQKIATKKGLIFFLQQTRDYPYPLGVRGLRDQIQKWVLHAQKKPFIS